MLTVRRTFQAKVGKANEVVAKIKELQAIMSQNGGGELRIYTDYVSGGTDRVLMEQDEESLAAMEAEYEKEFENPELPKWFEGLVPLIDGATVEIWKREV